jgi:hypothetical protein
MGNSLLIIRALIITMIKTHSTSSLVYTSHGGGQEKTTKRNTLINYFDEVKVGDAGSSFEDVSPSRARQERLKEPSLVV